MQLHKEVPIERSSTLIDRSTECGVWGSCFATEVGIRLWDDLYPIWRSPYGIVYNPLSMAEQMGRLISGSCTEPDYMVSHHGQWHSLLHHSDYSAREYEVAWDGMVRAFGTAREALRRSRTLVVTWGTAYYYTHRATGLVVANCHKLPAGDFVRQRATVAEIVSVWHTLLEQLSSSYPDLRLICTVSPVPHYADGIHEHTLSKSILHCALEELRMSYPDMISYFPAYEIMREQLRDYRYYRDDMAHPTPLAVEVIMESFARAHLAEEPAILQREWAALKGMLGHRPLSQEPNHLRTHYTQILQRLTALQEQIQHPRLTEEQARIETIVAQLGST